MSAFGLKNNVTAPTLSPDATMNSSFFEVLFRDGGENVVYIHNRYLTCMCPVPSVNEIIPY